MGTVSRLSETPNRVLADRITKHRVKLMSAALIYSESENSEIANVLQIISAVLILIMWDNLICEFKILADNLSAVASSSSSSSHGGGDDGTLSNYEI